MHSFQDGLARGGQAFDLAHLQLLHGVARLTQFLCHLRTQTVTVFVGKIDQPVTQIIEAVVEVDQHRTMLVFELHEQVLVGLFGAQRTQVLPEQEQQNGNEQNQENYVSHMRRNYTSCADGRTLGRELRNPSLRQQKTALLPAASNC